MLTLRDMINRVGRREPDAPDALVQAVRSNAFEDAPVECLERCWKLLAGHGDAIPSACSGALLCVVARYFAEAFEKRIIEAWPGLPEGSKRNLLIHAAQPELVSTGLIRKIYEIDDTLPVRQVILTAIVKSYPQRRCRDDLEFMLATIGRHDDPNQQAGLARVINAGREALQKGAGKQKAGEEKPWWKVW